MVLGILIGALAGAAIGALTGDEDHAQNTHPTSPRSDDSADWFDNDRPHSCSYCRRLVIDPAKAQRKNDSRLHRHLCGCDDCKWWLDAMVEKYGDPLFMQFNGNFIVEALANDCETVGGFFGLDCEDLVKMHQAGESMDLTNLSICCPYRKGNVQDVTRLEFLGPHLRSKTAGEGRLPEYDHYAIVAQPDDTSAEFVSNREVTRDLRDPKLLKKARQWLRDCTKNHKACRRQGGEKQFNPTRLIHLKNSQEGSVRIIRSEFLDSPVAYAALSYCWGGDQPGKTTRQNVAAREKVLLLRGQQKTITDAVFVAKRMGLEYLWIDSLCIVQDDPEDTARELPTMHDIYGSASLVISATRARNSGKGFLELHWPLNTNQSCGYRCPDGTVGTILLQRAADPSPNEEIHTRCWTLQEHLLARRVLSFGSSGLRWRCRSGLQFDGPWTKDDVIMNYVEQDDTYAEPCWKQMLTKAGPLSPSQLVPDGGTFALKWQDSLLTEWARLKWEWCQDKPLELSPLSETLQEWRHMVTSNFTTREITSPADRLPAISAIAAKFNQIIPGRYLAGLWEVALPHELLWEARKLECVRGRDLDSPFPSWSWASMGTSFKEYIEMGMESNTVPPNSVVTLEPYLANIKLQHANVPHGHVLSGSLKLEGYLLSVTCKYLGREAPCTKVDGWDFPRPDERRAFFAPKYGPIAADAQIHYLYTMLDVAMKEQELREVYCLEIVRRDPHDFKYVDLPSAGLVLRRAGDSFARIGVFNMGESGNDGWYIPGDKICTKLEEKSNVFVEHASQRVVEVI